MKLLNILLLSLISLSLSAQTLDEELGFIYVKADYLFETNRFDEAIQEFTKIIAKDASYKDALYKRAEAKFHVGAFKGTKNDLLEVFDIKGITPESVLLFGKTQKNLGDRDASVQTLETAGMISSGGSGNSESGGNTRSSDNKSDNKSNTPTQDEVVKTIEDKISDILGDLLPNQDNGTTETKTEDEGSNTRTEPSPRTGTTRGGEPTTTNTKSDNDRKNRDTDTQEVEPEPEVPAVDDSVRDLYIDEDVTLTFKDGIGARKILETPNILILSETSGTVVIDLCINENGKVASAEYNATASTLKTQSIISLAVRKSKEFWFKSSPEPNMCGTIVFNITGS